MVTDKKEEELLREILQGYKAGKRMKALLADIHEQGWMVINATIRSQKRVTIRDRELKQFGLSEGDQLLILAKRYPAKAEDAEGL